MASDDGPDPSAHAIKYHPGDWRSQRDVLAVLRDSKARRADVVMRLGSDLLSSRSSKLGDEECTVREQVALAALDCGDPAFAKEQVRALRKRFNWSRRVRRLWGMVREAEGDFDDAMTIYSQILKEDPADAQTLKRKVAICKARGQLPGAVDALNAYLTVFMSDADAWHELADIYTSLAQYSSAAFCYEELIIAAPQNALYPTKYAEALFTIGGLDNWRTARKYYVYALRMSLAPNLRAIYGLIMTTQAISASVRSKGKDTTEMLKENAEIEQWAKEKLVTVYTSVGKGKVALVSRMFDKLHI